MINLQDNLPDNTGFLSLAVLKTILSPTKEFFFPH